jgi:uncharacterized protein YndB with AHSA1/START domain
MTEYHFTRSAKAPIDTVWSILSDHRGMPGWTPMRAVNLEREGDPAPNGVGAVRVLRAVGPPIREEITTFDAPHRMGYKMLSGAPLRDYVGTVELAESGEGTQVNWSVSFTPRLPGAKLVARQVIATLIKGLVKEAERRARG